VPLLHVHVDGVGHPVGKSSYRIGGIEEVALEGVAFMREYREFPDARSKPARRRSQEVGSLRRAAEQRQPGHVPLDPRLHDYVVAVVAQVDDDDAQAQATHLAVDRDGARRADATRR